MLVYVVAGLFEYNEAVTSEKEYFFCVPLQCLHTKMMIRQNDESAPKARENFQTLKWWFAKMMKGFRSHVNFKQ